MWDTVALNDQNALLYLNRADDDVTVTPVRLMVDDVYTSVYVIKAWTELGIISWFWAFSIENEISKQTCWIQQVECCFYLWGTSLDSIIWFRSSFQWSKYATFFKLKWFKVDKGDGSKRKCCSCWPYWIVFIVLFSQCFASFKWFNSFIPFRPLKIIQSSKS